MFGTVGFLFSRGVLLSSSASTDSVPEPFVPRKGIDQVLVKPGPLGPLTALAQPGEEELRCIFTYGELLAQEQEAEGRAAWLYGAKHEVAALAHSTGRAHDVLQGRAVCWPAANFQDKLAAADAIHGFNPAAPYSAPVTRTRVQVVLRDGSSTPAFCYLQRSATRHLHERKGGTLLLVDGSSYLYRAFFAMPDLRADDGSPTGAVYGMITMLKKLRQQVQADHAACVFDAKGKTFRNELFEDYKATRTAMPEPLVEQISPVHEVVRLLGWPVLMVPGVEADDIIGTLARVGAESGHQVIVSTGDKDMTQLVNPQVTLVNTMTNEKLDEAGVKEKFGVPPNRIIDYLTLVGDTSDNIPGVKKVGPKTAVKWLNQYGSLDAIMAAADEIKGVVGNNLREALDWLPTSRLLVTIVTDVDMVEHVDRWPELDALAFREEDSLTLLNFYERKSLRSLRKELMSRQDCAHPVDQALSESASDADDGHMSRITAAPVKSSAHYETILTWKQLDAWLAKLDAAELVALDTEATSLDVMKARIVGISFATEVGHGAYVPVGHKDSHCKEEQLSLFSERPDPNLTAQLPVDQVLSRMRPWLENADKAKVGQNIKYDLHVFANTAIKVEGYKHDTMLQSYVLEAHQSHSLESLGLRHLGRQAITYESLCGKGAKQIPFSHVAIAKATEYAGKDSEMALGVHFSLWPQIAEDKDQRRIYEQIELPSCEVLFRMERRGVLIDQAVLKAQSQDLTASLLALEQQAYTQANETFNIGSPKQVGEILFGKLGLPSKKKTAKGAWSTDEKVLTELAQDYPLPATILEYRTLSKLKSTFVDKLPLMINADTGRVHTTYSQAVAVTGRLASSNPNLQNIPIRSAEGRRIREAFIAPPEHVILSADYSQIELRIMAHLSEDPALLRAFAEGVDVHTATASEVFDVPTQNVSSDQRNAAKMINFGLIYGMGTHGLASRLGIERSVAGKYIDLYFQRFAGVKRYMDETRLQARKQGYVKTVFGRRLWLPEVASGNAMTRSAAERQAINAPMQGTAADLIKLAMVAVEQAITKEDKRSQLVMQVHDELVLEVPNTEVEWAKEAVPRLMAAVAQLKVPLVAEVGVGTSWEKAH